MIINCHKRKSVLQSTKYYDIIEATYNILSKQKGVFIMKKSLHTLLTAAMFAVANVSAVSASAAADNGKAERPVVDPVEKISLSDQEMEQWKEELEKITSTGVTSTQTAQFMTTTTTTAPQLVYGPPLQDNVGDVNLDGLVDSFDVLAVRKMLIKGVERYSDGFMEAYYADMNNDGKLTIADLILLQRYLLGKITKAELQDQYHDWYGSHNIKIEKIDSDTTDVTTEENEPVFTTTFTEFDPGKEIVISLYGIKPSIDIIKDITESSLNDLEKETPMDEE